MKKQTVLMVWTAIILLIVIVFSGIYLKSSIDEANKKKSSVIVDCAVSDIAKYEVKTDGEGYTLVKENDLWVVEGNPIAELNAQKVEKLIHSASKISANGIIGEKDSSKFVLEKVVEITITFSDSRKTKLLFLGESHELSILKVDDRDTLYTIYTANRDILAPKLDLLRDFDVFAHALDDNNDIDYYEYQDNNGEEIYVRVKTAAELSKSGKNHYFMTKPYSSSVDDEKFEQNILIKLHGIKVERFVEDSPENLAIYGLDEDSRSRLTISVKGNVSTIYIGKNDGASVFVQKAGDDSVVALNSTLLEVLNVEPFYLLEGGLLKADVDKISGLSIKISDEEYKITKSPTGNGYEYRINGRGLNEEAFDKVIEELSDVKIMRELNETPKRSNDIVFSVYYNTGQQTQIISLTKINDKAYAAFINQKAEFAIEKNAIDDLIKKIRDMAANPAKPINGGEL